MKTSRKSITIVAVVTALTLGAISHPGLAIEWSHDCGETYPTLNVEWFSPDGPGSADGHGGCQNFGTTPFGMSGHCDHVVATKTREIWSAHMNCTETSSQISCEIHGSIACNGTSHPYSLTCNSPTNAGAFGNSTGAFCVGSDGNGVTCKCDPYPATSMHCGLTSGAWTVH